MISFQSIYKNWIRRYLGWRNWAVFYYNSILEHIFVFFYLNWMQNDFTDRRLLQIVFFILFSLISTTYGYLINDFADRHLDAAQGKPNTFAGDPLWKSIAVLGMVVVLDGALAIPFYGNTAFLALWLLWLFIATFYSLPPLRFKEKGLVGLILVVIAQRVLPIFILFAAFSYWVWKDVLVFAAYLLLKGLNSDINHQLEDFERDARSGVATSAVTLGYQRLARIFRTTLYLERIFLLFILTFIGIRLMNVTILTIPLFAILAIAGFFLILATWAVEWRYKSISVEKLSPFKKEKDIFQFSHLAFPHVVLPMVFLLSLIKINWHYLVFFLFFIVVYRLYDWQTWKQTYLGRLLA